MMVTRAAAHAWTVRAGDNATPKRVKFPTIVVLSRLLAFAAQFACATSFKNHNGQIDQPNARLLATTTATTVAPAAATLRYRRAEVRANGTNIPSCGLIDANPSNIPASIGGFAIRRVTLGADTAVE